MDRLNASQANALRNVRERCLPRVAAARAGLMERLGVSAAELDDTGVHLRDRAPVIMQFRPERHPPLGGPALIDSFLAEPVYKNQFQTMTSCGTFAPFPGQCRDEWERTLFGGAYHEHELIPEERPKYGGFSALADPGGSSCWSYGRCFFELRHEVKAHTTFCPVDSSYCGAEQVCTIDTWEILLDLVAWVDPEFARDVVTVAAGGEPDQVRHYRGSFIEAQVHGDVDLRRDVEHLVIGLEYVSTEYEEKLLELAELIGAPVKYTDKTRFFTRDEVLS
jgi:hypothetical protein